MAKLQANELQIQWCKGCGYCIKFCPRGALSIGKELNRAGFRHVVLDEEKCVSCGICRLMCPDCVFRFMEEVGK